MHLRKVERDTGITPKRLRDLPELPAELAYVWRWFCELHGARGGGFGPAPISYQDIMAWAALTRVRPTLWEVGAIRAIDHEYLSVEAAAARRKAQRHPSNPTTTTQPRRA